MIKKKAVPWRYVISDFNGEEIVGTFCKKELQNTNQNEFRVEKVIKGKNYKLYVKCKGYDSFYNSWKRHSINKWIFSTTRIFRRKSGVELDLSNYATKADLKTVAGVDTSKFAKKVDLANLKSNVDILDIDKLKILSVI